MILQTSSHSIRPRFLAATAVVFALLVRTFSAVCASSDDIPTRPEKKAEPAVNPPAPNERSQEELTKVQNAMLKRIEEEIKKAEAAMEKGKADFKSTKHGTKEHKDALAAWRKATHDKQRLISVKRAIENRIQIDRSSKPATVPVEITLGVYLGHPGKLAAKKLNMPKDHGMIVEAVLPDSPSAKAGVQELDVLLSVDGKSVPNLRTKLKQLTVELKPGKPIDAVILRDGKRQTLKLGGAPSAKEEEGPGSK